MTAGVSSPYGFVPLSGFVELPGADDVSHDVPVADGWCGELDLELRTHTPLIVSKGTVRSSAGAGRSTFFELHLPDGTRRRAIPGSSLRGLLRSTVEITSFGKFARIDDRRFAVRDLQAKFYQERMTRVVLPREGARRPAYVPLAHAGWLHLVAEADGTRTWVIDECRYARVEHDDLAGLLGRRLGDAEQNRNWIIEAGYQPACVMLDETLVHRSATLANAANRGRAPNGGAVVDLIMHKVVDCVHRTPEYEAEADATGYFVFTDKVGKKHRDFFFHDLEKPRRHRIDDGVFRAFADTHPEEAKGDDGRGQRTPWGRWKKALFSGEVGPESSREPGIPVFFLADEEGRPIAFGLTQMFKLPYDYTVADMAGHASSDHRSPIADWADRIFGYVGAEDALKGRVEVSHLHEVEGRGVLPPWRGILNSPKPTFYPNYVAQSEDDLRHGRYRTYLEPSAETSIPSSAPELSGWKRYPVAERPASQPDVAYESRVARGHFDACRQARADRRPAPEPPIPEPRPRGAGDAVATLLEPVAEGSVFRGRIHLHNVAPVELGAVVHALAFGGDVTDEHVDRRCFHALGMGKPFGFGRISLRIFGGRLTPNDPTRPEVESERLGDVLRTAVRTFEAHMQAAYAARSGGVGDWRNSPQITALLAAADPADRPHPGPYPVLVPAKWAFESADGIRRRLASADGGSVNDFVGAKKKRLAIAGLGDVDRRLDERLFPRARVIPGREVRIPDWYAVDPGE